MQVLVGARYGPREKVFDAVIDKVEVKKLGELSPRDIEHDNPEVRRPEELATSWGSSTTARSRADEIVTLIRFSEIRALARRIGRPESLGRRPQLRAAGFALDGEDRAEARVALGAAGAHLARALRALRAEARPPTRRSSAARSRRSGRTTPSRRASCAALREASPRPYPQRHEAYSATAAT